MRIGLQTYKPVTMIKTLFKIIPIVILALGCRSSNIESEIEGNWSCCSHRGDYLELYIQNGKYRYVTDFDLIFPWEKFYVKGDSLFQEDNTVEGPLRIAKSKIEIIDHNSFILHFENENPWVFNRIEEQIDISGNNSMNLRNTEQRGTKMNCEDQRTKEEIKKDSTDLIYFEF